MVTTSPSVLHLPFFVLVGRVQTLVDLKLRQIHTATAEHHIVKCCGITPRGRSFIWCRSMPLKLMGLEIPVTFGLVVSLLLRSAFNLYCRFLGIRRRGEGHGVTFVFFKGYALPKCWCFVPCRLRKRDRDVWPDFSPSTNALWKPSLGRHENAFSQTHYSDFGAPCLLPPASQSSSPALRHSVCLLGLAKRLPPKPDEYVYKSTEPSGCDWAAVLRKLI